jgi:hypothetical protein
MQHQTLQQYQSFLSAIAAKMVASKSLLGNSSLTYESLISICWQISPTRARKNNHLLGWVLEVAGNNWLRVRIIRVGTHPMIQNMVREVTAFRQVPLIIAVVMVSI